MQQARGEIQPTLHAAAVGLHQIVQAIRKAHQLHGVRDRLVECRAREVVERAEEPEVRPRRQLVVKREILGHQTDLPLLGIGVTFKAPTADEDFPLVRRHEAGNHGNRGGFARAVGTEQAHKLAAIHAERHVVHRDEFPEGLTKILDVEHVGCGMFARRRTDLPRGPAANGFGVGIGA